MLISGSVFDVMEFLNSTELNRALKALEKSPEIAEVFMHSIKEMSMNPQKVNDHKYQSHNGDVNIIKVFILTDYYIIWKFKNKQTKKENYFSSLCNNRQQVKILKKMTPNKYILLVKCQHLFFFSTLHHSNIRLVMSIACPHSVMMPYPHGHWSQVSIILECQVCMINLRSEKIRKWWD